ncbi:MAG: hypothetical protein H7233_00100 [Pseudorhodobacter sp.]|nr:hypothetical protein [Frankiaceae bacterium]
MPGATTGLTALVVLLVTGSALALWSTTGSGSGTGISGDTVAVTLGPGLPVADLAPGGSGDVLLRVANPNRSPVTLVSLALDRTRGDGGFAVTTGHPGCTGSTFGFTTQTNAGAGWVVPGKDEGTTSSDGALTITLPGSLSMATDAPDSCQGAGVTVYLTAGP